MSDISIGSKVGGFSGTSEATDKLWIGSCLLENFLMKTKTFLNATLEFVSISW